MSGMQEGRQGMEKAKMVVFGGAGRLGRHIVTEALRRGHTVTVATPDPVGIDTESPNVSAIAGDVTDPEAVMAAVAGHDVVVSAVGPSTRSGAGAQVVSDAARGLLAALPQAGVQRLVVLGATGTLEVAPGLQLVDLPEFPAEYRPVATAHREALDLYRGEASGLEWTVVTPPAVIESGPRTGRYRVGTDAPLGEDGGHISAADLAGAVLDEIESPAYVRQRFAVAH
ncbi:MAG: NAD(P)H-binding protein [Actinomycetota bacterium]|nr:NAD(P)H-binding protein [Actinomycetota bacterium]